MKVTLSSVFCLAILLVCLVNTEAWRPHRPRPCIDCRGWPVPPGQTYFNGCNWCRCRSWWPPSVSWCTLKYCKYNECYKRPRVH